MEMKDSKQRIPHWREPCRFSFILSSFVIWQDLYNKNTPLRDKHFTIAANAALLYMHVSHSLILLVFFTTCLCSQTHVHSYRTYFKFWSMACPRNVTNLSERSVGFCSQVVLFLKRKCRTFVLHA